MSSKNKTIILQSEITGLFTDKVNVNGRLVTMKVWKYQRQDMNYEYALNECDVEIIWNA